METHDAVCENLYRVLTDFAATRLHGYAVKNEQVIPKEKRIDLFRGPDIWFFEEEKHGNHSIDSYTVLAIVVPWEWERIGKIFRRVHDLLKYATSLVWLVDPDEKIVAVYRPGKEPAIFDHSEILTGDAVLPDLRCKVADFFQLPRK